VDDALSMLIFVRQPKLAIKMHLHVFDSPVLSGFVEKKLTALPDI